MAFKFAAIIQTIQIPISVKSMHALSERRKERKKKIITSWKHFPMCKTVAACLY